LIDEVEAALTGAGWASTVTPSPRPSASTHLALLQLWEDLT
jgi:hypothetical protein